MLNLPVSTKAAPVRIWSSNPQGCSIRDQASAPHLSEFEVVLVAMSLLTVWTAGRHLTERLHALRGRRTEIDAISGAIADEGERLGVPTPLQRTLWRLVKAIESTHAFRISVA